MISPSDTGVPEVTGFSGGMGVGDKHYTRLEVREEIIPLTLSHQIIDLR